MGSEYFIWDLNPIAFQLGFLEIRYYGILFATGIFLAYAMARKLLPLREVDPVHIDNALIYILVLVIICAHLVHLIFYEPSAFYKNPIRIIQVGSGLASHGGFIGAILGLYIYTRRYKISFWRMADCIAIGATITTSFIRFGNFANSEILGRAVDLPWSVVFTRIDSIPRHPSQLYEAVIGFICFAILYFSFRKNREKVPEGYYMWYFVFLYFTMRFLVEFVKDVQSEFTSAETVLTMGQWLSLPLAVFGAYKVLTAKRKYTAAAN
ncbi:MAG: prolipoprotein diacylglyceryl transferase [Leptospiraceae bacterium]|nr:prolipoprotein diacylglyceryl transferase [Leptospiraceae bacterium]